MKYRYREPQEMKESGIEWIGEIPKEWEVKRIKTVVKEIKGGIWGEDKKGNENDIPCIRIANFNRNKNIVNLENLTIRNLDKEKQKEYLLKKGDLLIEKSGGGDKQPVGFVTLYNNDTPAIYANFMGRIRLNKNISSEFINFLFLTLYSKRINLRAFNQTTGIQNLNTTKYFNEKVSIPNFNEQKKVANFLDQKTAEFDEVIEKKEKLIEKLEEAKKSLISEVVTGKKRVFEDENGELKVENRKPHEMKDSGVEWLGMIPEEWRVPKAKMISKIFVPERSKPNLNEEKNGLPWITVEDIKGVSVSSSKKNLFVSFENMKKTGSRSIPANSILASCVGSFDTASINTIECITNQQIQAYIPIKINPWFMRYCVELLGVYFESVSTSTTLKYVNAEKFGEAPIVLPKEKEQNEMIIYLDKKTAEFDSIIQKNKDQIEKIKEAKQSLISEAVTGKIEVLG